MKKYSIIITTLKTSGFLGARVLTQALSLILLTRLVGVELFGAFAAVSTLAVVMGTMPNLGAGYLMMILKPGRDDAVAHIWRYAWPLTMAIGAVFLLLYQFVAQALSMSIISTEIIIWIGLTEFFLIPLIMLLSFALQSHKQVPLSQFVQWLPLAVRLLVILVCFLLPQEEQLYTYVLMQFFAVFIALVIGICIVKKHVHLDWRPRLPKSSELTQGFSYSAMSLSAMGSTEVDKVLVVSWLVNTEASIYTAASRVVSALVMPVVAMLISVQPRMFEYFQQNVAKCLKLIKQLFLVSAAWGIISWGILAVGADFIASLFGASYTQIAEIMPLIAVVSFPAAVRRAGGVVLAGLEKPLLQVGSELAGMVVLVLAASYLAGEFAMKGLVTALIIAEMTIAALIWLNIYLLIKRMRRKQNK